MRGMGREHDQTSTGTVSGLARQPRRTRHARLTTGYQYTPGIALVRMPCTRCQQATQVPLRDAPRQRRHASEYRIRNTEAIKQNQAAVFPALPREQSGLEANETQSKRRTYGYAQHPAAVGMQTRRNVDGKYRPTAGVHGLNGGAPDTFQRSLQTGAEQGIDNDIAGLQVFGAECLHRATGLAPGSACCRCSTGDRFIGIVRLRTSGCCRRQRSNRETRFLGQTSHDIAIPAIIARATYHRDTACARKALSQQGECRATRALH